MIKSQLWFDVYVEEACRNQEMIEEEIHIHSKMINIVFDKDRQIAENNNWLSIISHSFSPIAYILYRFNHYSLQK